VVSYIFFFYFATEPEISNAIEIYKMIHDHVGGDGETKKFYQRPIKIKNST
jgi:hypothetical protein